MFSKANLQTYRFIHQRTSTEFAERRNAVEQKILDKKIKVFEKGQKNIREELANIKKEKYSRNFYTSAPHVKEKRLNHSRFVEVVVSTTNKGAVKADKSSNQRAKLNDNGKQILSDNNGSTNRKGLLTASGVGRTISSMRRASIALDISLTPGQVVRVSCPEELEEKVKKQNPQPVGPGLSYLSRRRHSVAIGVGIACNREQSGILTPKLVEEDRGRVSSFQTISNLKNNRIRRKSLPVVEIDSCSEDNDTLLNNNGGSSETSSPFDFQNSWQDTRYLFPGRKESFSRLAIKARRPSSAKISETSRSGSSSSDISGDEDDVDVLTKDEKTLEVFDEDLDEDFYGYCEKNETKHLQQTNRKKSIPDVREKLLFKRQESSPSCLTATCSSKPMAMKRTRSKSIPTLHFPSWSTTPTHVSTNEMTPDIHEELREKLSIISSNSCTDLSDTSSKKGLESTNTSELNNNEEIQGIRKMGLNNKIGECDKSRPGSPSTRSCDSESETGSATQSPRLLNRRKQYVSRRRRLRSETSILNLSENEKIVLRQTMLKRLEIQDGVAKAQRLSQQHFGDLKNKNKNPQLPRVASARPSTGIKATDLSNKSNRRWKNFMRTNSRTLGNMLDNATDVTKCRYLRCDSDDH